MRDDFPAAVKETLAKRVSFRCSSPGCRKPTSGPQEDPSGTVNIGVAAHIAAASEGGPRFDPSMTPEQRRSVANGIWLCQSCAKLIDSDVLSYTTDKLHVWKERAELMAARELEHGHPQESDIQMFARLERLMPQLLTEMRNDLAGNPLVREFILMKKGWVYNSGGDTILVYFFDDHPDLPNKMHILQNCG